VNRRLGVVLQGVWFTWRQIGSGRVGFQERAKRRTLGKLFAFPRWRAARLRGRNPREPQLCRVGERVSLRAGESEEGRREETDRGCSYFL
jgi:hypothetical protein